MAFLPCMWTSHQPAEDMSQVPGYVCTIDLASGQVLEGPGEWMGPEDAQEFASLQSSDGSAVLVQKDPATFFILQLPSLKVNAVSMTCN